MASPPVSHGEPLVLHALRKHLVEIGHVTLVSDHERVPRDPSDAPDNPTRPHPTRTRKHTHTRTKNNLNERFSWTDTGGIDGGIPIGPYVGGYGAPVQVGVTPPFSEGLHLNTSPPHQHQPTKPNILIEPFPWSLVDIQYTE